MVKKKASIVYDIETHKRFSEYCKNNGYNLGLITKKIVEEWLNERERLDEKKRRKENEG